MILRAHHLLCMLLFLGKGYDEEFTRNMSELCVRLHSNPQMEITLAEGADILCEYCPNLRRRENQPVQTELPGEVWDAAGRGCLLGTEDVRRKDEICMETLGVMYWQSFPFSDLLDRLKTWEEEDFLRCCGTCRWHTEGVCTFALFRSSCSQWK